MPAFFCVNPQMVIIFPLIIPDCFLLISQEKVQLLHFFLPGFFNGNISDPGKRTLFNRYGSFKISLP